MTFTLLNPTSPIQSVVSMAFGANPDGNPASWTWTDVSAYVRGDVSIRKGRPDRASTADPTSISFILNNTDGRFTPGNPASPYWPNVVRNVPCRVQVKGFGDPLLVPYERATGFVNGWPLTPNVGVLDVVSQITASGKLRRLQNRQKPLRSPLTRSILGSTAATLRQFWPCEDPDGSTQAASALSMGVPLAANSAVAFARMDLHGTLTGAITLTPGTTFGMQPLPRLTDGGTMYAIFPATAITSGAWTVQFTTYMDPLTNNQSVVVAQWREGGRLWQVISDGITTDTIRLVVNGATICTEPHIYINEDMRVDAAQSGADIAVSFKPMLSHPAVTGTISGATLAGITSFAANPYTPTLTGDFSVGEVRIWDGVAADFKTSTLVVGAWNGWVGETASARVTRVCAEQGIRVTVTTGSLGTTQLMGLQEIATFAEIMHSAETADMGFLHDGGPNGDLSFASNSTRFNATVGLALDYTRKHLGDSFAGTFDDQRLVNDSTVNRSGGSSAEYADASTAIEGDYDEGVTVNVAADGQLASLAQARVAIGVYPGMRFPTIDLDLIRSPDLAQQIVSVVPGARTTVSNLPYPLYPPGLVDQFVEGITETIGARTWRISLACSPAGPYRAAVIQDTTNPWVVEAGSSALNAGITATATSIAVKTTAGPLLSTAGGDYPRDLYCDGEQLRCTAVSGASSPQTATVTRSINGVVKAHSANAQVSLYRPATLAL